ncbi:glutamyl-tRNA amidotransferase [Candidatus Wolfebacteria bacterium]|nr:MAG: glutamyl-tRNA amidotransferase [Candidatus Wolfebacteria bacterium]
MTLHEDIKKEMIVAMKAKEAVKLEVLRGLLAAFINELVSNKRKPDEILPDEDVLKVIQRLAKQRKDSIEQFKSGGREDLVVEEEKELEVLNEYLPEMMSIEEITKIITAKKEELGIDDVSKKGVLMGALMKDLKGKADGGDVKQVVDSLFN